LFDWVRWLFYCSGRIRHPWVWKISHKNHKFSIFFCLGKNKSHQFGSKNTGVKDGPAPYLLQLRSMLGLSQSPSLSPSPNLLLYLKGPFLIFLNNLPWMADTDILTSLMWLACILKWQNIEVWVDRSQNQSKTIILLWILFWPMHSIFGTKALDKREKTPHHPVETLFYNSCDVTDYWFELFRQKTFPRLQSVKS